ncbi:hypothetical protein RI054_21g93040 [Pseudoscourfieldia marina]
MVITRKMAQRLSAGEILDELLTYEAMGEIMSGESSGPPMPMNQPYNPPVWKWRRWRSRFDQYRQVVYKGPITLSCYYNPAYDVSLDNPDETASFLARDDDDSLRFARDAIHPDSWYLYYGTFEPPDEGDGFFTVQTLIETLQKNFESEHTSICFDKPNDDKHLLIDALTGEEVVAFRVFQET